MDPDDIQWRVLRLSRVVGKIVAEPYRSERAARDGAFLAALGGAAAVIERRLPGGPWMVFETA